MTLSRAQRHRIQQIARGRSDEALRLLEGPKAVTDALARGVVAELWFRTGAHDPRIDALRSAAAERNVRVGEASATDFERMGDTVTPQGVLALVHDTAQPLDVVLDTDALVLWLDGVQDPGNVGAILRIAAAFGVGGVLVGTGTADPLGVKALRASAGMALRVPFARAPSAAVATACLASGRAVWTLEAGGRALPTLTEVPDRLILALGSEGRGFGDEVRRVANDAVGIEIADDVESLNVAVAAGIAVSS
nr:RNA methyltransferase [Planctomycetota bacterium]